MMRRWANAAPIAASSLPPGTRLIRRLCLHTTSPPGTEFASYFQNPPTTMEIRTQITREDLVALEWFNLLRSGNARYQLLFWAVVPPLAASGIPLWLTAGHLSSLVRLSFLLIVPVYMLLFYRGTRGRLARNLDDSCHTAQTQRELGDHSILLADEGIHITHEAETRFLRWTDILRVIVNSSYGFI